jgi:glycosyltransferase involved in cell wall biosynthesis
MSFGTPAVGTNVSGIRDTIGDGVIGYLASDDPSNIAEKTSSLGERSVSRNVQITCARNILKTGGRVERKGVD